ncbi:MAG: thioredoxin [Synergistaceae bacterium]|nr:thioredoxin [Synergistaceae bacterium]
MANYFTEANFDEEVLKAGEPVLVDFYADWCGPCQMMGPVVERIAADYAGKAKVGKVNVDESPTMAARFNVKSIPTFLFFKAGNAVDRVVGGVPGQELSTRLDRLL